MLSVFQYWLYYLLLWREISSILILLYQHMMWHYQSYHKFFRYCCQAIYIIPLFHIQITLSAWNPDLRNGRLLWHMLIFVDHKSFNQIQQLYHPNFHFFKMVQDLATNHLVLLSPYQQRNDSAHSTLCVYLLWLVY